MYHCTMFLLSYRNTSGSLGEQEMLWKHKPQCFYNVLKKHGVHVFYFF